ncbi:MAG: 5'/3'-nucleotidase SurE [Alphaproteobacteria bacterium]|nr:5'/3'-nucleotidase SurE [Alphaproteobacteria bacterium]
MNETDLSRSRILVTNDDGINAPGLKVLEKIARTLTKDVWVVAPETEQSGAGHSLTLTQPLRMRKLAKQRFAVSGSPTDCVLFAVGKIMASSPPDLVLSGVNRGANIGDDVTYSGTVAAAMEAAILDLPAIALSQQTNDEKAAHWPTATQFAPDIIRRLLAAGWSSDVFMNVNFPDCRPEEVAGVSVVAQGRRKAGYAIREGVDPRLHPYYWIGPAISREPRAGNTDYQAIDRREIAITPLHMDLTHRGALRSLKKKMT